MLIPLTQGKSAIVDAADFDWLSRWKWCAWTPDGKLFYAKRGFIIAGKDHQVFMHVLIFGTDNVDHINGNGLDNQRGNLRACTKSQNGANRGVNKNNTSGFKGVGFFKQTKRWTAGIMINKKEVHIGYFGKAIDAARAYDAAAIEHFGEFAKTNKMLGLLP